MNATDPNSDAASDSHPFSEFADNELLALLRTALNRPVRASDVPTGIDDPGPSDVDALLDEVERRLSAAATSK